MMLVYDAVLSGAGAALLPAWLIEKDLREGRLRAWAKVPNRSIEAWVLHAPAHLTSPKVRAFVDMWWKSIVAKGRAPELASVIDLKPAGGSGPIAERPGKGETGEW